MMRRFITLFLFPLFVLLGAAPALRAQYYSINIDLKTAAAMQAAYSAGAAGEAFYKEQITSILEHYRGAETAAAGIFSSEYLRRRALTDLGIWESATENWYYRRIYNMVAARIMPKVWTVAGMMLRSPHNALYWGSYLVKVCDETKVLCMQFESVVTNSTLSFGDVVFLQIKEEIAEIFRLSGLGGIDFKAILDGFADIGDSLTKEDLKEDLDWLYSKGTAILSAGVGNLSESILQTSNFNDLFEGRIGAAFDIVENYQSLFESLKNDAGGTLYTLLGGDAAVADLFDVSGYNITEWADDYARELMGQYYRQRWFIKGPSGVVYEEVFDSFSMDLTTFMARMNVKLSAYNDNEEGSHYTLESDGKNYYQTTDTQRIHGVEAAAISVTCSGGAKLSEGSTRYKCGTCGASLSAHTKECSMRTSVTDGSTDTLELESMKAEAQAQVDALTSEILALQQRNAELLRQISEASIEEAAVLRQEYNANKDKIEELQVQLRAAQERLKDIETALDDAYSGEEVSTDDYHRIPAIMAELQESFGLVWQGAGSWNGYTFTRKASMSSLRGTVTFKAKLSIARKPRYFLGIKILRAIVQIDWSLTAEYSDTHVAAVVKLDPTMDDREKADIVNAKIAEIARQYPDCTVSVEYMRSSPIQEDRTEDQWHLLWSSDRLEIAREVDTRLTKIYADLVSLEKMMSYRYGIIDVLKDIAPYVNADEGRRMTIVEQCRKRWIRNAYLRDDDDEQEEEQP
jgi:hypothetical protein